MVLARVVSLNICHRRRNGTIATALEHIWYSPVCLLWTCNVFLHKPEHHLLTNPMDTQPTMQSIYVIELKWWLLSVKWSTEKRCFLCNLADRTFSVCLGAESPPVPLPCSVPQGSIPGPLLFSLYLLSLRFHLQETWYSISFHCSVDDCQIYVSLSKKGAFSLRQLLSCPEEVKNWMALNFNEKKTELMVFGPSGPSTCHPADFGLLAPYLKPAVSNLVSTVFVINL